MILLKHFKKVNEDEHSATLTHKDGHSIKIAKKNLKGPLRKQLDELPLAKGGEVTIDQGATASSPASRLDKGYGKVIVKEAEEEAYADGGEVDPVAQAEAAYVQKAGGGFYQDPNMGQQSMPQQQMEPGGMSQPPPAPVNVQPPVQAPVQPVPAFPDPGKKMEAGIAELEGAKFGEAKAMGQQGADEAKQLEEHQKSLQSIDNNFQAEMANLNAEREATVKDYNEGHIDPNHFMNSKSVPGKISTAIGLLLGGLGAGLTGGENVVAKFLEKQIDRDVDAQKAEMGKKWNAISALQQKYGNLKDATSAYRIIANDLNVNKMAQIAAKSQNPILMQRAQAYKAETDLKYAPEMAQLSYRRALLSSVESGHVNPAQVAQNFIQDPHARGETIKELETIQKAKQGLQSIDSVMGQIAKLQTVESRVGSPLQSPSQIKSLNSQIATMAKEAFGKVSDQEQKILGENEILFRDSPATIKLKTENLKNMIRKHITTANIDANIPFLRQSIMKGLDSSPVTPRSNR